MRPWHKPSRWDNFLTGAGIAVVLAYIALICGVVYGYVHNIVLLVHSLSDPIGALFVARCVGVIAVPLGVVLGYV